MTLDRRKSIAPWVSIGIAAFIMVSGYITTIAVYGEKIKQVEIKSCETTSNLDRINSINSQEHKDMMKSLVHIETLLETMKSRSRERGNQ
jgi:hypothetical protein